MTRHIIITDCQVKPDINLDFLSAIGNYIADKKPDSIINIGDFADMPSLSSYDVGKKSFEGRTYKADVEATIRGMELLMTPISKEQNRLSNNKKKRWKPNLVLTTGNHEHRINRAIDLDRKLDGLISIDDLKYEEAGWDVVPFLQPRIIDGVAYCLERSHKVLTASLEYKRLDALAVGEELLAFDENRPDYKRARQYKTSIVEKLDVSEAILFEVVLSNGKTFKVTGDHRWLIKDNKEGHIWKHTLELTPGDIVPKFFDEWEGVEETYDMGWLAGMFDGEGWICKPNTKQGGIQLGIAQNPGKTLDKIVDCLDSIGWVKYSIHPHGASCSMIRILGSSNDKLKFLSFIGADRLITKFKPEMLGALQKRDNEKNPTVLSRKLIGKGEIVQIKTSTETMIVEGYAHHNCHYFTPGHSNNAIGSARQLLIKKHMSCIAGHKQGRDVSYDKRGDGKRITSIIAGSCYPHDENYMSFQDNQHWRGIILLNQVKDGEFDECFISTDYLLRKYGN